MGIERNPCLRDGRVIEEGQQILGQSFDGAEVPNNGSRVACQLHISIFFQGKEV